MNKKMRELKKKMKDKLAEIKALGEDAKPDDFSTKLEEMDALEKAYNNEARLYETEKRLAGLGSDEDEKNDEKAKVSGFGVIAKLINKKKLNDEELKFLEPVDDTEKALISGANATNGESYLVPEDVRTKINELKGSYKSLKNHVTVIPTATLSGSFVFEKGTIPGLVAFDDGQAINDLDDPKFDQKKWSIGWFGKIIYLSNILSGAEAATLTAYLNTWFAKNAVKTENEHILTELKKGKTAKTLDGWEALKKSINVDIDPDCIIDGVIITNQSGFNFLDEAVDKKGRPILQPDPTNATKKLFQSLPIDVYSDTQFPNNKNGSFPIIYGDTEAGCWFVENMGYYLASSSEFAFNKNQTTLRVIEGFAVMGADKKAYQVGELKAPAEPEA